MGVLNLWKILNVTCQPIDINQLQNKTLAVDLSIWICENSSMGHKFMGTNNAKPHLRALFFRCKSLLEIGCTLIFVREGDVIDLKQDTMKKRNNARFGTDNQVSSSQTQPSQSQPSQKAQPTIKKRSRFDSVADECTELLKYMGITVIRSPCGEAEKACAFLNQIGRCDGVITDDSDVFLYGARTVYRNFCLDKKSGLTIEAYSMDKIEKQLGYDRKMLIVLGLLLGSDYDPKGIPGVGKEMACKFLDELVLFNKSAEKTKQKEFDILNLIRSWPSDDDYMNNNLKYENRIRKAVLQNCASSFPNEEIIQEYLNFSKLAQVLMSDSKYLTIKWQRPIICELQSFNEKKQGWPFDYTANKVVPLIIKYEHMASIDKSKRDLQPERINRSKRRDFREFYEVVWFKMKSNLDRDLSELTEYVTLESKECFEQTYPSIISQYENSIANKKKCKKVKKKKDVELSDDEEKEGMDCLLKMYENYEESEGEEDSKESDDCDIIEDVPVEQNTNSKSRNGNSNRELNLNMNESAKAMSAISETKSNQNEKYQRFLLKDLLDVTSEEENENQVLKKSSFECEIIVLDSENEENAHPVVKVKSKKLTKSVNTAARKIENDIANEVLKSFENISLSDSKNEEKIIMNTKSQPVANLTSDLDIPFSQRMKKRFENATIFK